MSKNDGNLMDRKHLTAILIEGETQPGSFL